MDVLGKRRIQVYSVSLVMAYSLNLHLPASATTATSTLALRQFERARHLGDLSVSIAAVTRYLSAGHAIAMRSDLCGAVRGLMRGKYRWGDGPVGRDRATLR
jgi:hypothetical protein